MLQNLSIMDTIRSLKLPSICGVTKLHLGPTVPFAVTLEAIRDCTQLRQLSWRINQITTSPSHPDVVRLPHLEYLEYKDSSERQNFALSLIAAPGLSPSQSLHGTLAPTRRASNSNFQLYRALTLNMWASLQPKVYWIISANFLY